MSSRLLEVKDALQQLNTLLSVTHTVQAEDSLVRFKRSILEDIQGVLQLMDGQHDALKSKLARVMDELHKPDIDAWLEVDNAFGAKVLGPQLRDLVFHVRHLKASLSQ